MGDALRVLITGGGGFLGRRLAARLLADGALDGRPVDRVTLADVAAPSGLPHDPRLAVEVGDVSDAATLTPLIDERPQLIYHLAAVVSGAAEQDFDLGMRVNLDGSRALLDVCRRRGHRPRLVFASSVAVYGGDLPAVIGDDARLTPQNSYGVQKAIVEQLISDYSRKGYVDGRALRLPTIVVRPGKPNAAASSFASGIIREPLAGEPSVCPVDADTELWILSPRRAVDALLHGAALPGDAFGHYRGLALPGITVTVREMVEALAEVGGAAAAARVSWRRDPQIDAIISGWASRFEPRRALELGFRADDDMSSIIQSYIDEERPRAT